MTAKKILIVDDNPSNLKLFTFLLSSASYALRTAVDAREALAALAEFRPDLVLLDLQLPDMDGLELTRQLKGDPATRDIPIVAVTAYAMKGDEERARAAGVDGYISKPIDKNSFRAAVAAMLADK
jgi:two-component system cell cycle response regulator DivK